MPINPFHKKQKVVGRRPVASTSNTRPAFSYYSNSKQVGQPAEKARKRSTKQKVSLNQLRMIPTVVALLAILASVVYSTTLGRLPTVIFAGEPSSYRSTSEYQSLAERVLSSSIFNHSKLTINTKHIELELLSSFPELDAVKLALPIIGRRPTLTLHVRQPALILTTKTNVLIIDTNGKAVADSRSLPSSIKDSLLTLQDQSGLELKVGDQAVTNETVYFIDNVRHQLDAKKLKISKLVLPVTPNELDIYIRGLGYYIKADVTGDARLQMGAFLAVKSKLGGLPPHSYMDVRVEEKAFYK